MLTLLAEMSYQSKNSLLKDRQMCLENIVLFYQ